MSVFWLYSISCAFAVTLFFTSVRFTVSLRFAILVSRSYFSRLQVNSSSDSIFFPIIEPSASIKRKSFPDMVILSAEISIDSVRTYASPESVVESDLSPTVPLILFAENMIFSQNADGKKSVRNEAEIISVLRMFFISFILLYGFFRVCGSIFVLLVVRIAVFCVCTSGNYSGKRKFF